MADKPSAAEAKKLLGGSVEESRVKRLEKQQSRYRDRGGLFIPADQNPLLDILLARGVNGESPTKQQRASAPSPSPPRNKGKGRASVAKRLPHDEAAEAPRKSTKAKAATTRRSQKSKDDPKPKTRRKQKVAEPAADEPVIPEAGPSKMPDPSKRTSKVKGKTRKPDTLADEETAKPIKATAARKKQTAKTKTNAGDEAPVPQATRSRKRAAVESTHATDEPAHPKTKNDKGKGKTTKEGPSKTSSADTRADNLPPTLKSGASSKPAKSSRTNPLPATEEAPELAKPPRKVGRNQAAIEMEDAGSRATLKRIREPDGPPRNSTLDSSGVPSMRRKRPKLYVPSDSESDDDDVPILAMLKSKAAPTGRRDQAETHTSGAPAPKPSSSRDVLGKVPVPIDPPSDSAHLNAAASSKTTLDEPPVVQKPAKGRQKREAPAKTSKQDSIAPPQPKEPTDKPKEKSRTAAKRKKGKEIAVAEHLSDDPPSEVEEPQPRPVKRRKATVAENDPAERPKQASRAGAIQKGSKRVTEVAELPVAAAPTKQLKSTSRIQKENRKTTSKKGVQPKLVPRKPRPRLSLFPEPEVHDSEDELDFLR